MSIDTGRTRNPRSEENHVTEQTGNTAMPERRPAKRPKGSTVRAKRRKANHTDPGIYDDEHQLFLPEIAPGIYEKIKPAIYKKFALWRDANSLGCGHHDWRCPCNVARAELRCIDWLDKQLAARKPSYVLKSTIEALIDSYGRSVKTDPDFGYNSQITAYVMRHIVWREHYSKRPHRHLFEFRNTKPRICPRPECKRRNSPKALFCDQCTTPLTSENTPPAVASEGT
jgi:hypothetical protein